MIQSSTGGLTVPLYKLTSPSGKSYIGLTTGPLQVRLNHHRFDSERGSTLKLHKAFRKYGFDNFKVEVLDESIDPDELCRLEIAAIKEHDTFGRNGYNLTLGGEGALGTKLTDDRKLALVQARARRRSEKTPSELSIEKARRSSAGKKAVSNPKYGRNHPDYKHAEKIAEARAKRTPEQIAAEKANRSAAAKARWEKAGHREKVSAAQAEAFASDEFKARRSAASKAGWSKAARLARANRTPEQIAAEKANRSAAAKARWAAGNFRKGL